MSIQKNALTLAVLSLLIAIGVTLLISWPGLSEVNRLKRLVAKGKTTVGKYASTYGERIEGEVGGGVSIYRLSYTFEVSGKMYSGNTESTILPSSNSSIEITYLPEDPNIHEIDPQHKLNNRGTWWLMGFLFSLPIYVASIALFIRRFHPKWNRPQVMTRNERRR